MTNHPRRRSRARTTQRGVHLVAAVGISAYIYLTPDPASPATFGIRWVAVPVLVFSGLAMWLWPRLRRRIDRTRAPRRATGAADET